ncbi:MAG: nitrilase, partial [Desulfotignum sp.]
PYGHAIYKAVKYEEELVMGAISRDMLRRKKIALPYLKNDDPYFTFRELGRILYSPGDNQ